MYRKFFKRLIDLVLGIACFIVALPILLVLALFLFVLDKENPFFLQVRPGKDEQLFSIIKFRTMNSKKDKNGVLLPDSQRITRLGSFIRKTSLDEIPQLVNVIKGDMSFVGPRPLLPQYLPLYSKEQKKRHDVRPGITGWAQVNGRNAISWTEKFILDVYYVNNCSFKTDLKIFYLTFVKVIKREGVNKSSDITMEAFSGHN